MQKAAIVLANCGDTDGCIFQIERQPLALTDMVKPHLGRYMVTHADRGDIMMEYEDFTLVS